MAQQDFDRRVIIYPDYINSAKTVAQGRRIPTEKACDWPTLDEMKYVCDKALHLEAEMQLKRYPRNWCPEMGRERSFGRIRVQLRNEDGTPVNPDVPNRRTLMLKLAEYVKQHPDRHRRPGQKAPAAAAAAASSSAASSSKQSTKKSGKKKK